MNKSIFNESLYEDMMDPELRIPSLGILKLSEIKKRVKDYIIHMNTYANTDNWDYVSYYAYKTGVMKEMLEAILNHEKKMQINK